MRESSRLYALPSRVSLSDLKWWNICTVPIINPPLLRLCFQNCQHNMTSTFDTSSIYLTSNMDPRRNVNLQISYQYPFFAAQVNQVQGWNEGNGDSLSLWEFQKMCAAQWLEGNPVFNAIFLQWHNEVMHIFGIDECRTLGRWNSTYLLDSQSSRRSRLQENFTWTMPR